MGNFAANPQGFDLGLLVVRLVIGLVMAAHGSQKLFGWFGGYGLKPTGDFFAQLGFQPGTLFAAAAGLSETLGGLLFALGFLGPVGPALIISVMIVAAITVHWEHGLFNSNNGYELPLIYSVIALGVALTGFGSYSLDAQLGIASRLPLSITAIVLGLGVVGALGNLALRRRPELAVQK
jgi:putative oxidoreductase